jgi:glycosyltransferase involved in cell wall biosynthesis
VPALISCVIPVHDGERYLAAAIESVLAQDHAPVEIVVVDDGSTDASAAIASGYGDPVRVVWTAHNGPGAARDAGVAAARGEYVSFLDADDLYRPAKLSTQLRELETHPGLDLSVCHAQNFWEPGLEEERDRYVAQGRVLVSHHFATLLARRSVFDLVGPIPARVAGEYAEWFLRATDLGLTSRVIPDVLIDRRMHSRSHSHVVDTLDDYFAIAKARIDRRRA